MFLFAFVRYLFLQRARQCQSVNDQLQESVRKFESEVENLTQINQVSSCYCMKCYTLANIHLGSSRRVSS